MSASMSTPLLAKLRSSVAKGLAYLRNKQSDNGGFCFFRFRYLDRPNLRDTYHAMSALKLWGRDIPRAGELIEFLRKQPKEDTDGLFYFANALRALGIDLEGSDLTRIQELLIPARLLTGNQDTERWLERVYRTLDLQKTFAPKAQDEAIHSSIDDLANDGGYGETPNVRETALSLKILTCLERRPKDLEATRRFIEELQHPAIGFVDMPGSQYGNLEILGAGIECCALLHLPVRFKGDALSFVMACQSADGSFSRVPTALPDVAYTHQALQVIAWLATDLWMGDGL